MTAFSTANPPASRRALVVGLGTAGLTTAIRLQQIGWNVTAVEQRPWCDGGDHFVALVGAGASVARRMGVLDAIGSRYIDSTQFQVDRQGRRGPGMKHIGHGMRTLLRGEVGRSLFGALPGEVEVRFSTSPTGIVSTGDGALVSTYSWATDEVRTDHFDLVVGADGLHSTVRRLAFGPAEEYLHPLHHIIARCLLDKPVAGLRLNEGLTLAEPSRAAWVLPSLDHPPSLTMTYRTDDVDAEFRRPPGDSLRLAFGPEPLGPVLETLIGQYDNADSVLFERVQQVRMSSWRAGRVVVLGDAAWSLALYPGMGTSSAMAGADQLAYSLQRHRGDIPVALGDWEHRMHHFIEYHQGVADGGVNYFVPQDRRRQVTRAMAVQRNGVPQLGINRRRARSDFHDLDMKDPEAEVAWPVRSRLGSDRHARRSAGWGRWWPR